MALFATLLVFVVGISVSLERMFCITGKPWIRKEDPTRAKTYGWMLRMYHDQSVKMQICTSTSLLTIKRSTTDIKMIAGITLTMCIATAMYCTEKNENSELTSEP